MGSHATRAGQGWTMQGVVSIRGHPGAARGGSDPLSPSGADRRGDRGLRRPIVEGAVPSCRRGHDQGVSRQQTDFRQATFDPGGYSRIARAHDARLSISLVGDLRREGERWSLRNPRDLAVIEEDDGTDAERVRRRAGRFGTSARRWMTAMSSMGSWETGAISSPPIPGRRTPRRSDAPARGGRGRA